MKTKGCGTKNQAARPRRRMGGLEVLGRYAAGGVVPSIDPRQLADFRKDVDAFNRGNRNRRSILSASQREDVLKAREALALRGAQLGIGVSGPDRTGIRSRMSLDAGGLARAIGGGEAPGLDLEQQQADAAAAASDAAEDVTQSAGLPAARPLQAVQPGITAGLGESVTAGLLGQNPLEQGLTAGLAHGGWVDPRWGPQGTDTIPAVVQGRGLVMLDGGEYVLPKDTTQQVGVAQLDRLVNATHRPRQPPGYTEGGWLGGLFNGVPRDRAAQIEAAVDGPPSGVGAGKGTAPAGRAPSPAATAGREQAGQSMADIMREIREKHPPGYADGGAVYGDWRPVKDVEKLLQERRQRAIYGQTGAHVPHVSDRELAARAPVDTRAGLVGGAADASNLPKPLPMLRAESTGALTEPAMPPPATMAQARHRGPSWTEKAGVQGPMTAAAVREGLALRSGGRYDASPGVLGLPRIESQPGLNSVLQRGRAQAQADARAALETGAAAASRANPVFPEGRVSPLEQQVISGPGLAQQEAQNAGPDGRLAGGGGGPAVGPETLPIELAGAGGAPVATRARAVSAADLGARYNDAFRASAAGLRQGMNEIPAAGGAAIYATRGDDGAPIFGSTPAMATEGGLKYIRPAARLGSDPLQQVAATKAQADLDIAAKWRGLKPEERGRMPYRVADAMGLARLPLPSLEERRFAAEVQDKGIERIAKAQDAQANRRHQAALKAMEIEAGWSDGDRKAAQGWDEAFAKATGDLGKAPEGALGAIAPPPLSPDGIAYMRQAGAVLKRAFPELSINDALGGLHQAATRVLSAEQAMQAALEQLQMKKPDKGGAAAKLAAKLREASQDAADAEVQRMFYGRR